MFTSNVKKFTRKWPPKIKMLECLQAKVYNTYTQMTLKIKAKVKNKVINEKFTYDFLYPLNTFVQPRLII